MRSVLQKPKYLPQAMTVRCSGLLPPTQYDTPFPKKMKLTTVLIRNWEIIPLFLTTATSMGILGASIWWAVKNKVDYVMPRKRNNISKTMNLLNPTTHKIILIEQKYDPWPEMHDVLCKMRIANPKTNKTK
ncbi:uncharacterized protein LOC126369825 [Pectinophora gossypiella]|uniref:uncharacterized protein LOC126369825 n=1 Tax=Pectinophora gossypiella TaxID=13191 RepID=UPI00214EB7F8|nr:uncharacterized protein LOC126369825 [Pectinophora gossypiella]